MGEVYKYNQNDDIIRDSYSNKYDEFYKYSEQELLEKFKNNAMFVSMNDTHKSYDLSSICYVVLEELIKTNNNPIKKCKNCKDYFIPNARLDESYCDYPKENDKTCKEKGALLTYKQRLEDNAALGEYRKIYQQKSVAVTRSKGNKQMKKAFDDWKKKAKEKVNELKRGKLTEEQVLEWLKYNR